MYRNVTDVSLSKRERETVLGLIRGDTQAQIAVKLGVSRKTINQYCYSIRKKTNSKSTISAIAFLVKNKADEI
jgi:Response regulator containing a CheY-like receiver domain and an HTH DNA-binding domain